MDELTKIMSVVNESEQQDLVGGTFYFDYSGNYLGSSGSGSDIRIATSISFIK